MMAAGLWIFFYIYSFSMPTWVTSIISLSLSYTFLMKAPGLIVTLQESVTMNEWNHIRISVKRIGKEEFFSLKLHLLFPLLLKVSKK
jgi:hypothetical protein